MICCQVVFYLHGSITFEGLGPIWRLSGPAKISKKWFLRGEINDAKKKDKNL